MFTAVAGDFSPLAVDASGGSRHAPPSLVVAVAAGLGSMDMPIPDVSAWEWQNWKFPRPVRAGDTIYARWTLTQKRQPVKDGRTGIAVWRVDVHVADGAVCAEGEVGASVVRSNRHAQAPVVAEGSAAAAPTGQPRRRRRGRGSSSGGEQPSAAPAAAAPAPPQPQQQPGRSSSSRRRRRRRTGGQSNGGGDSAASAAPAAEAPPPAPVEAAAAAPPSARAANSTLSRVMKRLRRT